MGSDPVPLARSASPLTAEEVAALRTRLHRIQGQVGALVTMIETGRECRDVVQLLAAATAALHRTGFVFLNNAMRQCATDPATSEADLKELENLFMKLS